MASEAYQIGRSSLEALNSNQRRSNSSSSRRASSSSSSSSDNELAYDPGFEDPSNTYQRSSRELSSNSVADTPDLGFESSNEESKAYNRTNQKGFGNNSFNNIQVNVINTHKALQGLSSLDKFAITQNNGIDPITKKRVYTGAFKDSDQRNMLLGYKKINNSANGQTLTIHPDDYKKFGKKKLTALVKKANRLSIKKDYPLVFDGHNFMPDFIEYQKTKKAKHFWNKMKDKFYRVDKEKVKKKAFHPCVEKYECYVNQDYNIFNLHHLRYQKLKGKGYFRMD